MVRLSSMLASRHQDLGEPISALVIQSVGVSITRELVISYHSIDNSCLLLSIVVSIIDHDSWKDGSFVIRLRGGVAQKNVTHIMA